MLVNKPMEYEGLKSLLAGAEVCAVVHTAVGL